MQDRYKRSNQALADELATLKRQAKERWENLSPKEQAIIRRGDEKIQAAGLTGWGTLERRVNECQEWERQHPFAGISSSKQPFQGVVHAVESLQFSIAFPWDEYIRLSKTQLDGTIDNWWMTKGQRLNQQPTEEQQKAIRKHYEQKVAELESNCKQMENQLWLYTYKQEIEREFADAFDGMVQALMETPIASDKAEVDITYTLEHLKQREALISIGSQVSEMETIDLNSAYPKVSLVEFHRRERQVQAQTRNRYCRERSQVEREIYSLFAQEEEQKPEQSPKPKRGNKQQPEPKPEQDADDDFDWQPFDED